MTSGDKSIIANIDPSDWKRRNKLRIGARIGSVIIYKASTRKPRLAFGNHENTTRANIIKYNTEKSKSTARIKINGM